MSNRQIVKQDFKLVNAKYKLNTSEIKIIMNAISEIKMEDDEFHTYRIHLKDLSTELHNKSLSNNHTTLKNFCENLMKKPIYIPEEGRNFVVLNWFQSIRYLHNEASFEYKISSDLKPYLLELKERFVKYNLKYILPLTSNYSIRLYQLFKEYEKASKRTFTVEELQELLQVPSSYKRYSQFKQKVIQVAERELIENCDIFFEYEEIKLGRKVNELLFRIKPNREILDKENPSLFENSTTPSEYNKFLKTKVKMSTGEVKTITKIIPMGGALKIIYNDKEDEFGIVEIEQFLKLVK